MGYSGDDDRFDVIVIGAGIMGSAAAYNLAKRGWKTLLLEQFDFLHHRGSSHGESRTIRATYPEDYYCAMVTEAAKLWVEAQSEIGYKVYFPTNHLDVGPADDVRLQSLIASCRKTGLPHRVLNNRGVAELFSGRISIPENWIGVSTELGGVIKPTKAVAMFQTLALKHGAVLRDNTKVETILRDKEKGGVIVKTVAGENFGGKKCIVTVGAWIQKLVKIVTGKEIPTQPLETQVCYWRVKEGSEEEYSIDGGFPTFASYGMPQLYGTPSLEYPGLLKVALHGGQRCDPDKRPWGGGLDKGDGEEEGMKEWIKGRFSGAVNGEKPAATQLCMYTMTPDGDYVIDYLGGEFGRDVVVGGGFSGHGFKMGPTVGRILAEMATEGRAEGVELKYFRLGRFGERPGGNVKVFGTAVKLDCRL